MGRAAEEEDRIGGVRDHIDNHINDQARSQKYAVQSEQSEKARWPEIRGCLHDCCAPWYVRSNRVTGGMKSIRSMIHSGSLPVSSVKRLNQDRATKQMQPR